MFRHDIEKNCQEQDEVELSRRSFFGRLAVGAVLSMGVPGVVHAAKSASVKADKSHRLAKSGRSAVRLPKNSAFQTANMNTHKHRVSASHAVGKKHKVFAENDHLYTDHTGHAKHLSRVSDIYTGKKKHSAHHATHYAGRNHRHSGRSSSYIQPVPREPLIEPVDNSLFLADHSRFPSYRALAIQNPHTGDKLNLTYFEKGRYLTDALDEISYLLRDYRTGDVHDIDPELLDQLHDLKNMLGLSQPFDVICGYRSPLTNARLHAEHSGVANNSFHIHGRAVDIRLERFDLRRVRSAALAMHRGGVGYYPGSNFLHLDTGTFRTWTL